MARNDRQTNVRLPKELKSWLCQTAKAARRSLTAEMVHRLQESRERQLAAQQSSN